jgi:hypothetical protein
MREQMGMGEHPFSDFPDFRKGTVDVTPFQEYALTDMLLMDKDQRSLLERVESKVQVEVDRIMASYDLKLWREKVVELLPNLERDAIREAGATAETSEDRIKRHTGELLANLRLNVRGRLYMLLDDRKQGGLEFVLSLLEQVKARLAQRDLANAQRNGKRYRDIRDALRTRQVEESLNNLSQAAGRLFGKDAQAREVMNHLKRDIADYLRFHLLAVAPGQAIDVMNSMSAWLGNPQGTDEHGQAQWSGIAGEFQEGRRSVQAMLAACDQRIGQLRADARHEHATYIKLASDVLPQPVRLTSDVSGWAEEVLLEFGGSAKLFPQLGDERLRADLLLKLFRRAQTQLSAQQAAGLEPAQAIDPLLERLGAMSPQERHRVFSEWIKSAMPWINARFSAEFTPSADQFKCFIGVGDPAAWRKLEPRSAPPCRPASCTATRSPSSTPAWRAGGVLHRAVRLSDDGAARPADLARLLPDREPEDPDPPALRLDALPPSDLALDGRTEPPGRRLRMVPAGRRAGRHPPQAGRGRPRGRLPAARPVPVRGRAGLRRVAADRQRVCDPLERPAALLPRAGDRRRAPAPGRDGAVPAGAAGRADAPLPAARLRAQAGSRRDRRPAAVAVAAQHHGAAPVRPVDAARRERCIRAVAGPGRGGAGPARPVERDGAGFRQRRLPVGGRARGRQARHPAEFLASEASALQALERRTSAPAGASAGLACRYHRQPVHAGVAAAPGVHPEGGGPSAFVLGATPMAARYKLFVNGAQRGPYALEEVAQQLARGEIDHGTRIWNMQWNPRLDKWKTVGEIPELAAASMPRFPIRTTAFRIRNKGGPCTTRRSTAASTRPAAGPRRGPCITVPGAGLRRRARVRRRGRLRLRRHRAAGIRCCGGRGSRSKCGRGAVRLVGCAAGAAGAARPSRRPLPRARPFGRGGKPGGRSRHGAPPPPPRRRARKYRARRWPRIRPSAPIRLRWWILALALLWGVWLVAKPSTKKIDRQHRRRDRAGARVQGQRGAGRADRPAQVARHAGAAAAPAAVAQRRSGQVHQTAPARQGLERSQRRGRDGAGGGQLGQGENPSAGFHEALGRGRGHARAEGPDRRRTARCCPPAGGAAQRGRLLGRRRNRLRGWRYGAVGAQPGPERTPRPGARRLRRRVRQDGAVPEHGRCRQPRMPRAEGTGGAGSRFQ